MLLLCPRLISPVLKHISYSFARVSVAVRVAGVRHLVVFFTVLKQILKACVYCFLIGTDKLKSARVYALGALRGISHYQNGNSVAWAFLLDPAGIGQAKITARLKIVAVKNLDRLDYVDTVAAA